jgi:hypothetical protein
MTKMTKANEIKVGQVFTHPTLGNVKVIAVLPLGTIEVKNIYSDRYYRISGLRMVSNNN